MQSIIRQLLAHESLSKQQCYRLFSDLSAVSQPQQAVILSLLAAKKESKDEILAAREYLFEQTTRDPLLDGFCSEHLIDLVGTGGDGIGTFNISTAASLLVASCNVPVAKHGGGRVTSSSGSTDVIQALHIPTFHQAIDILNSIEQHRYVYLSAPHFNPVFKLFKSVRSALPFPTIFNLLGPLINPLQPRRQVIGVYCKELVPVMASVLKDTGSVHAMVVHAVEGLDELSISGPSYVAEVCHHQIKEYMFCPRDLGFPKYRLSDISGGTPLQNATLIQAIMAGELQGAMRDIVLLNAAAGLLVADKVTTFADGIEMALGAIESGAAGHLLQRLQCGACA